MHQKIKPTADAVGYGVSRLRRELAKAWSMEFPPDAKYEDIAITLHTTIFKKRAAGASE